jgi:hypothetical protein
LTTIEAQMVMENLHERPSKGHFATKITKKIYWMQNIGGQLCT